MNVYRKNVDLPPIRRCACGADISDHPPDETLCNDCHAAAYHERKRQLALERERSQSLEFCAGKLERILVEGHYAREFRVIMQSQLAIIRHLQKEKK